MKPAHQFVLPGLLDPSDVVVVLLLDRLRNCKETCVHDVVIWRYKRHKRNALRKMSSASEVVN